MVVNFEKHRVHALGPFKRLCSSGILKVVGQCSSQFMSKAEQLGVMGHKYFLDTFASSQS